MMALVRKPKCILFVIVKKIIVGIEVSKNGIAIPSVPDKHGRSLVSYKAVIDTYTISNRIVVPFVSAIVLEYAITTPPILKR